MSDLASALYESLDLTVWMQYIIIPLIACMHDLRKWYANGISPEIKQSISTIVQKFAATNDNWNSPAYNMR